MNELTAFGETSVAQNVPVVQVDATYGIDASQLDEFLIGSGVISTALSEYNISSGGAGGVAALFSTRYLSYHPGQGGLARLSAAFDTPQSDTSQLAGVLNGTDGFAFGYNGLQFGILHRRDGEHEIQQCEITAAPGGAEDVTLTLNGVAYGPIAVTSPSTNGLAFQVAVWANANIPIYRFSTENDGINDFLVVRSLLATGPEVGAFTLVSTGTGAGTFTQRNAGVLATDDWVYIDKWNNPRLKSQILPQTGNVYQIKYNMSYGNIEFYMADRKTGDYVLVHTIQWAGLFERPSAYNPHFRLAWSAVGGASATPTVVRGASGSLFSQGERVFTTEMKTADFVKVDANTNGVVGTLFNADVVKDQVNHIGLVPQYMDIVFVSGDPVAAPYAIIQGSKNVVFAGNNLPVREFVDEDQFGLLDTEAQNYVGGGVPVRVASVPHGGSRLVDLAASGLELAPGENLGFVVVGPAGLLPPGSFVIIYIGYKEDR